MAKVPPEQADDLMVFLWELRQKRKNYNEQPVGPFRRRRLDALLHMNARKTHCVNGHPFDAENTKLMPDRRRCRQCARDVDKRRG